MNTSNKKLWQSENNQFTKTKSEQLQDLEMLYRAVSRLFIQRYIDRKLNNSSKTKKK